MAASCFSLVILFFLSQPAADTELEDKKTLQATPTAESVLEQWRAADTKWQTMDAQLVSLRYDHTFEVVIIGQGRLYFEKPGTAWYEVQPKEPTGQIMDVRGKNYVIRSAQPEIWVWNGKEVFQIDPKRKEYSAAFVPKSLLVSGATPSQELTTQSTERPQSWLQKFSDSLTLRLAKPQNLLPLLFLDEPPELQDRFALSVETKGERLFLTAKPKSEIDKQAFREITVLIDRATGLPTATRYVAPTDSFESVVVLGNIKLDKQPSDRDEMLNPRLRGMKMTSPWTLRESRSDQ